MIDRRRKYDNKVGHMVIVRQQCMSYARRLMREFATMDDINELIDLYNHRVDNTEKGVWVRVKEVKIKE